MTRVARPDWPHVKNGQVSTSLEASLHYPFPDEDEDSPSRVLLILVRGRRESLISSTTSVRVRKAGSCFVNFIIWPGNQDGGAGSRGFGIRARAMVAASEDPQKQEQDYV